MKIFTASQIKAWDAYTIAQEPISSIDLMERAANAFAQRFLALTEPTPLIHIFCGSGNNGGDGFAVARILKQAGRQVLVYSTGNDDALSSDCKNNKDRLSPLASINHIKTDKDFPSINTHDYCIDALFGTGLSRPLEGMIALLISHINSSHATIFSVDIASGLFANQPQGSNSSVICPTYTLSFQAPKLAFLFPENEKFTGRWEILDIGLSQEFHQQELSPYHLTTSAVAKAFCKPRNKFSHKGSHGHACLWAGSYGKIGAAVLASKAVLRSGAGLLTVHIPKCGYATLQSTIPDAMVETDTSEIEISETRPQLDKYTAIGIGPGIGESMLTEKSFASILTSTSLPLVIDADALNMLGKRQELFRYIPANSILTPHPKEFERMAEPSANSYERLELLQNFCKTRKVITVLKGAHTVICSPEGQLYFNTTGNPAMAKAGMGDVLTGIILGLQAQGYSPLEAAILGVYLHGKAGDILAETSGPYSLLASDVADGLGKAFLSIV